MPVLAVVGLMLSTAGCQVPIQSVPTGYVFTIADADHHPPSFAPYVSDSFSCSGISPAQLETVLEPGDYTVDLPHCYLFDDSIGISFWPWDIPEAFTASRPLNITYYEPFMFYRFPDAVGVGGVWWDGFGGKISATPQPGFRPSAGLELFHAVQGEYVYSRGLVVSLGGDWQNSVSLKMDPIIAVTQLAFLAAQGLKAEYPDLFPNPLPDVNPSPYVPLAGAGWPTSTATGTPSGGYMDPPSSFWWAPETAMPTPETTGSAPTPPTPTATR